jgi:hypothetical protein
MTIRHRVQIHSDGQRYRTTGAIAISAANPMRAAATALLEQGRDPGDRLQGVFEGAQISPMSLGSLVRPRKIPRTDHRQPDVARNVD